MAWMFIVDQTGWANGGNPYSPCLSVIRGPGPWAAPTARPRHFPFPRTEALANGPETSPAFCGPNPSEIPQLIVFIPVYTC